jgi:hypothetical protein
MKVSLILPVWNEEKTYGSSSSDLHLRLSDMDSFFSRFSWDFELVVGLDKSQDKSEEIFKSYPFKKLQLRLIENKKHLGRAKTIQHLLCHCQGNSAVTLSMDLSTPLADVYALLIEGHEEPCPILALGNTLGKKKKRSGARSRSHFQLEQMLYEKMKFRWGHIQDPLTSLFSINSAALEIFKQNPPKLDRWYFTPQLLDWAQRKFISVREVEVQKRLRPTDRIPLVREWLKSLL